jgi:hypothetical protein
MSTATKIEWTGILGTFTGPREVFRWLFPVALRDDRGARP